MPTLDNPDFINMRALTPKVCIVHVSGMANKLCTGRICDAKICLGYRKAGNAKLTMQCIGKVSPKLMFFLIKGFTSTKVSGWVNRHLLSVGGWDFVSQTGHDKAKTTRQLR